ncbi:DNA polymerase [Vibrio phage qdvp001]|uniref:DNA polymerase n=1 Tax=Vibrio phage qdvp001 TaxID=1003177 RepID=UPI0007227FBA|nr:DNA polymerase [Vibrio phage qdvp001]ALM62180.1 DNA polymerase [Vibrio phage qdvp001]
MLTKEELQKYTNLPVYGDIETVGLWDSVKTVEDVHVIGGIVDDPDTGEEKVLLFHNRPDLCNTKIIDPYDEKEYTIPERAGDLITGFRWWYQVGRSEKGFLSIHNCAQFDKAIVEKVMPKCVIPNEKWEDTFIYSKIQYFDRPCPKGAKSPHGLASYALRMGIHKPEITDYTKMDTLMLHRIVEDFKAQKYASQYLKKEREMCKQKLGVDFEDAYKLEFEYAITCQKQEAYGAAVDKEHMLKCVEDWDKRLHELEGLIEPMLPPTVKPQGQKVTRKEMAIALGFPEKITSKMVEPTELVNRSGEQVEVKIKPYYKPSTNFHTTKKVNQYSGFHISYGDSPTFIKKNELTSWIKENYPDTKPKEWDIEKDIKETLLLNKNTCDYFEVNPEDTHIISGPFTRVKFEGSKLTQHEVVKGMLIKGGIKFAEEWNLKKDVNGQVVKAEYDTVVSYPTKALPEHQIHFSVKKGEAMVTSPKFGEKEYDQLKTQDGKMVGEYNTTMHRRRFLLNPKDPDEKGLIANIREDGRIPCGVNNSSTGTLRSSHRIWVNAPGDGALYGKEIRQSIIAPENRILVSHDMNSAQLSIAAYYANNFDYFKAVCFGQETKLDEQGNDILHPETGKKWYIAESGHCTNMQAFGLVSPEEVQRAIRTQDQDLIHDIGLRRKKSKGATFGVIFGCSGKKLALMLGIDEAEGTRRKNMFLEKIGLDRPMQILERMCEKNKRGKGGYIELPFGYYAYCSSPHARFNYLDQGTEAACQKFAELWFDKESKRLDMDAHRILSYHK